MKWLLKFLPWINKRGSLSAAEKKRKEQRARYLKYMTTMQLNDRTRTFH